ncbi:MAG: flagellar motor protein MotB [Kordia sp.]|nr:MAG: flagellar motor protein MotB [Kordia sp.]
MKKLISTILYSVFFMFSVVVNAQQAKLNAADEKFENLAYIDAISIYKKLVDKGSENPDVFKKIADANYFNANYTEAEKWYTKLLDIQAEQTKEVYFRYGQSLKGIGNYNKAAIYLVKSGESQKDNDISFEQEIKKINAKEDRYTIEKSLFNTEYSDYPGYYKNEKLYVVTASSSTKVSDWNNEPTSDIFVLENTKLKSIKGKVNTKFNEGSLVITKDESTMYFTRNNYTNRKVGKDDNDVMRLKLYRAFKVDGSWKNTEELPFNSNEYSVAHPALSLDENILYFVSDKEGGKGGSDIYEVEISVNGTFGTPKNMENVNTQGNEMFPFVAEDDTFYFSSMGHIGLGGLDVFMSNKNKEGAYSKVYNVGKPINSQFDDFAFMINSKKGFFASNRDGKQGDDIFSFVEIKQFTDPCFMTVEGIVKDKKTGQPLPNSKVLLLDGNNMVIDSIMSDDNAKYTFAGVYCQQVKIVRAEKDNYITNEVLLAESEDKIYQDILLDIKNIPTAIGTDIGLVLNPIYFDLEKSFIRLDAGMELDKLVAILSQYPNISIEIGSHTDSRAVDSYNMSLSERRAQATLEYLVEKGISKERLTAKGYGENRLKNECSNGVKCGEEQHQNNRRSEFVILKN